MTTKPVAAGPTTIPDEVKTGAAPDATKTSVGKYKMVVQAPDDDDEQLDFRRVQHGQGCACCGPRGK